MPNSFTPLHHLKGLDEECGCLIITTSFPEEEIPDGGGESFDTTKWERKAEGAIDQLGGGLDMTLGAKVKWIGSCQKHAGGIKFVIDADVNLAANSEAVLYYACDTDLDPATGYEVRWKSDIDIDDRTSGCDFEVKYQGTRLFYRYMHILGSLSIAFEHISDDDGGGVYITLFDFGDEYFSYLHESGPQIADDQYWGIGAAGPVTFNGLTATYNGNQDGGHFCQECPAVNKETSCDFEVGCGGGTLKTQPGATLIDYDWGAEACDSTITPHNEGGWYKQCDPSDLPNSLDYSFWTFTDLSATFNFAGSGHCSGSGITSTTGYVAWRFFRVVDCENTVTFTINLDKSKYVVGIASMELETACGVPSGTLAALPAAGIGETWPVATTESITAITTCSGSSSTYFKSDACVSDDSDTVTIDFENLPVGIYRARCSASVINSFTAAPSACSTQSVTAWPPVSYEFVIEGDALTYDPICR